MNAALYGLATGLATGIVMTRWGLCFNRGVRQAFLDGRPRVLRAFVIAVGIQLLLLPLLIAAGVTPLERQAALGGIPLVPVAELAGGLVFGAGMALAGGCVTGILWKAGEGQVALALAVLGFATGEILIRGPGIDIVSSLADASRPDARGLPDLIGVGYSPLALVLGVALLAWLLRRGLRGLVPGIALGVVAALAWVTADAAGHGYGLGFVGTADGTRHAIENGSAAPYTLWLALGVAAGGAVAGARKLTLPSATRAARALAGGILMGAGGTVALGCNIGHGLTGLPLLSLGSTLATAAMVAGALAVARLLR
ncbi:MAG TPA: YeeE/YedE thiosulfate transporter family protein [Solirubrobacteraceae bacterium]|nr:YeeE/YedE thiosulfate transporter family protein [Solirubrobacteraceae bacterium]